MGWTWRVRIPPSHRRPLGTCDIGAVPVLHRSLLVLQRLRFCCSVPIESFREIARARRCVGKVPGVHPDYSCKLCALRWSSNRFAVASRGFDPGRQEVCSLIWTSIAKLTGCSKYLQITFKAVVGHFHRLVLAGNRQSHCATALGILLTLAEKPTSPPVDSAQRMDQDTSVLFQRLRGLREEDGTVDLELPLSQDHVHGEGSAGTVPPTTPTPASGSISASKQF